MSQRKGAVTSRSVYVILPAIVSALALSGCLDKKGDAGQVAARTNDSDITIHQVNYRLQQDRNLRPENVESASRLVLTQLVDQELVAQKAVALKLDKSPQAVQALEAARREVLTRIYVEQITQTVPKPVEGSIRQYYNDHPELFAQRRIYLMQEFVIESLPAEKVEALRERVRTAKSAAEFISWVKSQGLRVGTTVSQRPAEQVPMGLLTKVAAQPDGTGLIVVEKPMMRIVFRNASRPEPVDFDRAKPAIEQFLANVSRREAVENSIKGLRTSAKIEYLGKFAGMSASQAAPLPTTQDMPTQPAKKASGDDVSLPTVNQTSQISLPTATAGASGVEVKLENSGPSVEVRLGNQGSK